MYNIKLCDYVPKPKPATSDRIVAAHYYAAWKKGAPGLHNGFDDLHDYPERTPLLGYYDEENPKLCDWEIKWALEHGINCFIYCWYRKKDNENHPVTVDALRCGHAIHEAFFHARYAEMMNFAIMYENSERWGNTNAEDLTGNLMPFWMENYFKRPNYLKIDNKPVLFICGRERFDSAFKSVEEQRETLEACREYAKENGFDGLLFAVCIWDYNDVNSDIYKECEDRGYDFHFGYNAGYSPEKSFPSEEEIIKGQCDQLKRRLSVAPNLHIPVASCFRDATPRTTDAWKKLGFTFEQETIYHLSADGFRKVIRRMKEMCDKLPKEALGRRIFMIDNWNEWDEGHYVSPSHEYGFRYLQAIREELTLRDNLPDYRTPQEIGLSDFNNSWNEPDLYDVCKKKFNLKD